MMNALRMSVSLLAVTIMPVIVLPQDCSEVRQQNRGSAVSITVKKTRKNTGAVDTVHGTGFVNSEQGYVHGTKEAT